MVIDDEFKQLQAFLSTPKAIPQVAFEMNWAYSTAAQRLKVLVAGGIAVQIKRSKLSLYYIPLKSDEKKVNFGEKN